MGNMRRRMPGDSLSRRSAKNPARFKAGAGFLTDYAAENGARIIPGSVKESF